MLATASNKKDNKQSAAATARLLSTKLAAANPVNLEELNNHHEVASNVGKKKKKKKKGAPDGEVTTLNTVDACTHKPPQSSIFVQSAKLLSGKSPIVTEGITVHHTDDIADLRHVHDLVSQTNQPTKPKKKKKKKKGKANDPMSNAHLAGIVADKVMGDKEGLWYTDDSERQRIREFWLSLSEEERKALVKLEKEAVLKKMKEQQKQTCSCHVCGRKRIVIEEELEMLYDAYYEELENFASDSKRQKHILPSHLYNHCSHHAFTSRHHRLYEHASEDDIDDIEDDFDDDDDEDYDSDESGIIEFGTSLTVKGGILTVADDILKNDGQKFLDLMEQLAQRKFRPMNEEEEYRNSNDQSWEDYDDDEDEDYDEDDEDHLTEQQRMEEGRRMFQIFAAKMFEQRVLAAYRDKVAQERERELLRELEEEEQEKIRRNKAKQETKEKKRQQKLAQKQRKEEEMAALEKKRREEEQEKKRLEEEKLEKERQRLEQERLKREAELRRKQEEERLKREAERKRQEDKRKQKEEKERKQREEKERLEKQKQKKEKKKKAKATVIHPLPQRPPTSAFEKTKGSPVSNVDKSTANSPHDVKSVSSSPLPPQQSSLLYQPEDETLQMQSRSLLQLLQGKSSQSEFTSSVSESKPNLVTSPFSLGIWTTESITHEPNQWNQSTPSLNDLNVNLSFLESAESSRIIEPPPGFEPVDFLMPATTVQPPTQLGWSKPPNINDIAPPPGLSGPSRPPSGSRLQAMWKKDPLLPDNLLPQNVVEALDWPSPPPSKLLDRNLRFA